MTARKSQQFKVESLAVLDRAIDAIDCEDLHRANMATLTQVRASCEALLAVVEAEEQFRTQNTGRGAAGRRRSSPAWTTRQFRLRDMSLL